MTFLVIGIFIILLLLGIPISMVLGMITIVYFLLVGDPILLQSTPQRLYSGLENFGLLAVPLFMLAGELMNEGGITNRLVKFSKVLIGHFRGGLAYVTVLSNMFLASILGSANAQAAMMSKVMVPEMEKEGYPREFSSSITLASSIIAPIIPPSMIFIIYGTLSGTSIGGLFIAGIIPGIIFGLGFVLLISYIGLKQKFPKSKRATWQEIRQTTLNVIPALLVPFIIIVGILSGVFTATESAGVACVIALLVGVFFYKELKWRKLPKMFISTVVNTATVTFLIAMANIFGWMIAFEQIPQLIVNTMLSISENPFVFLLLVNVALLIVGMFLDGIAALIILTPVFMPLLTAFQIDPIHFGLIICINLTIGLLTPPVGTGLFIVSSIANVKFENLIKASLPFTAAAIVMLLIITYWSDAVLFLPRLFGL
ncbi:TRAP transporter, DctM subunit [Schinkia azotoformans MEV2011]|uniref:TRAP transporter, DctM subunit n=1 Tax=Schinkia azotoformans MEV2011 TaxID=1348973 RepID=A0A072NNK6_SCHAZ|nr:TRAP transporter large permease [Schinkia azotoformans]KEF39016.1 TRAP transporter, DctM subunit [Schinkia azotoformans MEV2011]MEC1694424.1 TRAP transporter large permease [Schinkia azotoformans]MEC1714463.1 TRAP transporter large permease [Schinkia azotoformans]MEC1723235.1 TRAP transporter large permease [Schinkia azotoformans]MEC1740442.1 TRAP transporter large permease [Schinkia azotoformans]